MNVQKTMIKTMAITVATAGIVAYLPTEKVAASTPQEMQAYYDEKMSKNPIVLSNSESEALGSISDLMFFYYNARTTFPVVKDLVQLLNTQTNAFYKKYSNTLDNGTYNRLENRGLHFKLAIGDMYGDYFTAEWINTEIKGYYIQALIDKAKASSGFKSNEALVDAVYEAEVFLTDKLWINYKAIDGIIEMLEFYVGKVSTKEADNKYLKQLRAEITNDIATAKKKNEKETSTIFKAYNTEITNLFEKELKKELTFENALIVRALVKKHIHTIAITKKSIINENLIGIERGLDNLRSMLHYNYTFAEKQYIKSVIVKGENYIKANNYTLENSEAMSDLIYNLYGVGVKVPNSFVITSEPKQLNMMVFQVNEVSQSIAVRNYESIKITSQQASNKTPTTVSLQFTGEDNKGILMMKAGNTYTPVGYTIKNDEINVKVTRSGELTYVKDAVVPLKDIKGNYFENYVQTLANRAIVSGYQNKFEPNKFSSRAEFFTMLGNGLGITKNVEGKFKDATGKWYDGVTSTLAELGYVQGSDGKVNGEQSITRQDAFTVIGRLLENEGYELPNVNLENFKDADKVANYAAPYIQLLMQLNIVSGGQDGMLNPTSNLTKGQMAKVLVGVLKELNYLN